MRSLTLQTQACRTLAHYSPKLRLLPSLLPQRNAAASTIKASARTLRHASRRAPFLHPLTATSPGSPAPSGASLESIDYSTATGALGEAAMHRMAASLRIDQPGRHLFLCSDQTVPKCCRKEDGIRSWDYLKKRCKELGLETGERPLWRTKANCLRICAMGPVAVVYPDQVYYHSCSAEVIERILQEHIIGGKPVEEYRITVPK